MFGQPCTTVVELEDAILFASAVPKRACLLVFRAPRASSNTPLFKRVLLLGVLGSRGPLVSTLARWLFAAGIFAFFGGVEARNDFCRNIPGEQEGRISGEIFLQKYLIFQEQYNRK